MLCGERRFAFRLADRLARWRRLLIASACVLAASAAQAVPITFSFDAVGSGSLGGESFVDSAFSIVATADTDDVLTGANGRRVHDSAAVVRLASGSSASFTGDIFTVVNVPLSRVGLSDFTAGRAILFVDHPGAAAYGLDGSIGPLTGTGVIFNTGFEHATTAGSFVIDSAEAGVFTASVVTEPGSAALLAVGAAVLLGWRRRTAAASSG